MAQGQWTNKLKKWIAEVKGDDGYFVYELNPSRENTSEIYQFSSSTQAGIVDQVSLFMAFREYQESRKLSPSWKQFEDNFMNCFPAAAGKSRNFGADATIPWGRDASEKPKFKVLFPTDSDAQTDQNNFYIWCIEFWPNRKIEDESYLLIGFLNEVMQQCVQIMQLRQTVEGLNHVLGLPQTEHLKRAPKVGLSITIIFSNYKTPPFRKNRFRPDYLERQVTVPWIKRTSLNYSNIRSICGGNNGLTWGRDRATAYVALSDDQFPENKKGMPQVWCGGNSVAQAKRNIKKLLELSDCKIISLSSSGKDYREGTEASRTRLTEPESYTVYPCYFTIENSRIVSEGIAPNASSGKRILLGKLDSKRNRFPLWSEQSPTGWEEAIEELTRWGN